MFKQITDKNWLLYAQKHYDNPTFETEKEFWDDIKRFKYLKRLFRKYETTGSIKIRLVVNHIVVLQNESLLANIGFETVQWTLATDGIEGLEVTPMAGTGCITGGATSPIAAAELAIGLGRWEEARTPKKT